ncbi:hypothetical protein, partial [Dysosmobacter sp.]|uniref:hypothetical protein n=1 Tax=Dysosmobacter sp. TaxID=2591382 RepID=UPI003FD6E763
SPLISILSCLYPLYTDAFVYLLPCVKFFGLFPFPQFFHCKIKDALFPCPQHRLIELLLQIRNERSLIHDTENCIHVDFGQYPLQCFVAIRILQRGNKIKVVDFSAIDLNAGKRD